MVIVNTCSVTATADQGARQAIRRIARENPQARIVATGCYATRCADEVAALPGCDPRRAQRREVRLHCWTRGPAANRRTTHDAIGTGDGPCGSPIAPGVAGRTAFTLRVQTGCEERCTYCIIPTTRGASRSLPSAHVVARGRTRRGVRLQGNRADGRPPGIVRPRSVPPVVLAASCCSRSIAIDARRHVPDQLARADGLPGGRSSISSRSSGRFEPHFHLPLQHASDRDAARDAAAVHARRLPPLVDDIARAAPARIDRQRT